jgi:mevalonate kinase
VGGLGLRVEGDLPAGVGLGSSAALAVATARAVCAAIGRQASEAEIEQLATVAEARFHGRPSGVDVAIAARGGFGLFRKATGFEPIDAAPITLAIGLSGEPKSTAAMLAHVAGARERDPAGVDAAMAALGDGALAGAAALRRGDLAALGPLLDDAHRQLAAVGLSTPTLDAMVEAARRAGAFGAKLTGAGGGGAVIALAPGREHHIIEAWRRAGRDGFACAVGVPISQASGASR